MKGVIDSDHMPLNSYELRVAGVKLTFTSVTGLEEELDRVDLPDRTRASGGRTKPGDATVTLPMHHTVEQAFMEEWFGEAQDPVRPTYKRTCTLIVTSLSTNNIRTFTLDGVFVTKRKIPDFKMDDEGNMAEIEWSLSWDDILPL